MPKQIGKPGQQRPIPKCCRSIFCLFRRLEKRKSGARPIGEVIRLLVAKCIAKESASDALDLFLAKELGVAVKGRAGSIVRATKVTF